MKDSLAFPESYRWLTTAVYLKMFAFQQWAFFNTLISWRNILQLIGNKSVTWLVIKKTLERQSSSEAKMGQESTINYVFLQKTEYLIYGT